MRVPLASIPFKQRGNVLWILTSGSLSLSCLNSVKATLPYSLLFLLLSPRTQKPLLHSQSHAKPFITIPNA